MTAALAMLLSCSTDSDMDKLGSRIRVDISQESVSAGNAAAASEPLRIVGDAGETFTLSISEREYTEDCGSGTRGEITTTANLGAVAGEFTLDIYSETATSFTSPEMTSKVKYTGGIWGLQSELWWPYGAQLNFWAYLYGPGTYPFGAISHTQTAQSLTIGYEGPISGGSMSDAAILKDLAYAYTPYTSATRGQTVPITFKHALSAICFAVGTLDETIDITGVSVNNVLRNGTCSYSPKNANIFTWTKTSSPKTASYSQAFNIKGSTAIRGNQFDDTTNSSKTLWLVPQEITDDVSLTVHFKNATDLTEHSVTRKLKGTLSSGNTWKPGYAYTYTISGGGEDVNVSVDDAVISGVKQNLSITNTGNVNEYIRAAIVANWFKDGLLVAAWKETDGTFAGLCGSGWSKGTDGFYYYSSAVGPGQEISSKLFTSYTKPAAPVSGATLRMEIVTQAAKAVPGKTCQQAFGL